MWHCNVQALYTLLPSSSSVGRPLLWKLSSRAVSCSEDFPFTLSSRGKWLGTALATTTSLGSVGGSAFTSTGGGGTPVCVRVREWEWERENDLEWESEIVIFLSARSDAQWMLRLAWKVTEADPNSPIVISGTIWWCHTGSSFSYVLTKRLQTWVINTCHHTFYFTLSYQE